MIRKNKIAFCFPFNGSHICYQLIKDKRCHKQLSMSWTLDQRGCGMTCLHSWMPNELHWHPFGHLHSRLRTHRRWRIGRLLRNCLGCKWIRRCNTVVVSSNKRPAICCSCWTFVFICMTTMAGLALGQEDTAVTDTRVIKRRRKRQRGVGSRF